ncbi:MAG: hypothetical protein GWP05_02805 [Anaerolineaceae bacterium]|nr:hypothetical protein [Anaerolineaceae bacterium]
MSFAEVRHQESAIAALGASLAMQRVPQAFIFCGPAGVGKALTARLLARTLLCDKPLTGGGKSAAPQACGKCPQCRLCDTGNHPDLSWFRKPPDRADLPMSLVARGKGSPEAATINESVQLKPMQAACHVTVVEDAERMNASSANAFLKTFEESPEGSYLLLVVTALDRLLPTIRSRGQLVRFRALPEEFVAKLLLREEGMSADQAEVLARFGEGSCDQALALWRSGFLGLRRDILDVLPEAGRAEALVAADGIIDWANKQAHQQKTTNKAVEENELRRLHLKRALALLASVFRDALVLKATGDEGNIRNSEARAMLKRIASRLPSQAIERGLKRMLEYQIYVDRNLHNKLLIENACLEMCDLLGPVRS